MRTGIYCGKQPAITALIAIFSTVAGAQRGGTTPITSCGLRLTAAIIWPTRSSVGGMIGKPSVQPFSSKKALTAQRSSATSTRSDCNALESIVVLGSIFRGFRCRVSGFSSTQNFTPTPETRNLTPVLASSLSAARPRAPPADRKQRLRVCSLLLPSPYRSDAVRPAPGDPARQMLLSPTWPKHRRRG